MVYYTQWVTTITVLAVLRASRGAQYLMRTSPGGDGIQLAGVWAGKIDTDDNGNAVDLFTHGFSSIDGVDSSVTGLSVSSLSRDPESRGLLVVTKSSQGYSSLAVGSGLCGKHKPEVLLHNVQLADADNPYMSDNECGHKCGWGPVALYDGGVYFVFTAVYGRIYNQLERHMEIRKLINTGACADVIKELGPRDDNNAKDFYVLQCSTLVATLFTEAYVKPNPRPTRWSSHHLALGSHEDTLHFYLQLLDTSAGDSQIRLVHVAAGGTSMRSLTSSILADVFAGSLDVSGLGSVDYLKGTLCWTAGDTLRCSLHEPGGSVEPVIVLPSGEALDKGICTVNIPDVNLQRALTGVAIAENKKRLAVYFGCFSEQAGKGGVGLVTLAQNGLEKHLYSVTSAGRKVYGSHVMVMGKLKDNCPLDMDDTTTAASGVTSAATSTAAAAASTPTPRPSQEPPTCVCTTSVFGSATSASQHASYSGFMSLMLMLVSSLL